MGRWRRRRRRGYLIEEVLLPIYGRSLLPIYGEVSAKPTEGLGRVNSLARHSPEAKRRRGYLTEEVLLPIYGEVAPKAPEGLPDRGGAPPHLWEVAPPHLWGGVGEADGGA